jgi:hypothetical protein
MIIQRQVMYFINLFFCSVQLGSVVWACPPDGCDVGSGGWERMKVSCGIDNVVKEEAIECFEKQRWVTASYEEIEKQLEEGYIAIGGWEVHSSATQDANIKVFIFRQWAIDKMGNMYLLGQLG